MAVSVNAAGEDAIKKAIRAFQAASLLPDTVAPAAAQPPVRNQGTRTRGAAIYLFASLNLASQCSRLTRKRG
jgi:hypothetical protein